MTVLTGLIRKAFVAVLAVMASLNAMAHPWENLGIDKDAQLRGGYTLKGRVDFFGARLYTGDAWVAAFAQKSNGTGFSEIPCAVKEINSKGNVSLVIRKKLPFAVKLVVWDCNARRTYSATDVVSFSEDRQSNDDEVISVTGQAPTYQVVFDLNGEDGGSGVRTGGGALTQTVSRLSAALAPTVKAQAGYEFVAWDTDFSSVKKPMTVRAMYQIAEVRDATVTFDANGGTVSPATKTVLKGEAVGELPTPDWPLCIFGGWFTSLNGGTRVTADTIVTGDVTYYAHWTPRPVTVTFNANGGTVSPTTHTVDMGAALGDLPQPTRNGHTFAGWWTAAEGGDPVTAETVISSSVTYYAHWTAIMKTVTFNANGGTVEPATRSVAVGQAVLFLPDPSRRGYTFNGWWTAAVGGTQVTAATVVSADVTYYAHWTPITVLVSFDANGGTVTPSTKAVNVYSAIGDKLPTPTRSGHSFAGWWTVAEGGDPVTAETVVSAAVTYYAHWTVITRTVTFDANGGTVEPATRIVDDGHALTYLPTPSRSGYVFNGWWTAATGGAQVAAATVISANATYYAHWTAEVRATVTFNAVGGSVSPSSLTLTRGSTVGELPTPTRDGCVFVGWFTSESGGTQISADTVVSANVTFYAQYAAEVTFNANGGALSSGSATRTVALGSRLGSLPTPTMDGNTFVGWFTAAEGGTQVTADTIARGRSTYYAHWTASVRTVTVSFDFMLSTTGETVDEKSRTVAVGTAIGELPVPTFKGYEFVGWFTQGVGGFLVTEDTIVSYGDTYYAHWKVSDKLTPTLGTPIITASCGTSTNHIELTWEAVPGATHYQVWRSSAPDAKPLLLNGNCHGIYYSASTTGTNFTDRLVNSCSNYYYTVRALTRNEKYEIEAVSEKSELARGYAARTVFHEDEWDMGDNDPSSGTLLTPPTDTEQMHGKHVIYSWDSGGLTGHQYAKDWCDCFRVDLQAGTTYLFETEFEGCKFEDGIATASVTNTVEFTIHASEEDAVSVSSRAWSSLPSVAHSNRRDGLGIRGCVFTPSVSGTYYLRCDVDLPIKIYNQGFATYSLRYKILKNDAWDPGDDGGYTNVELSPTESEQIHGPHTLDEYDVVDCFRINMIAGKTYVLEAATEGGMIDGALFCPHSMTEAYMVASDNGSETRHGCKIVYTAAESGTHYLRLKTWTIGASLEYSLKYSMYSPSTPTKDLAFMTPAGQGWPASCWLSDGIGLEDKSEFMPTNAISVHYAYGVSNGTLTEGYTNRIFVLKRRRWNSETFDWADYNAYSYSAFREVSGLELETNGVASGDFTFKVSEKGTYAVLIWLDCCNAVNETDETNNLMVKTFTVSAPQVTVSFDVNGGTGSTAEQTIEMGSYVSPPKTERSGHKLDGWYTQDGTKVSGGYVSFKVYADATYYAHWSPKECMDVKFDANGGSCASSYYGIKKGYHMTSLPLAWHTNLLFAGWWTAKEGGVQFNEYTRVDDDIQLYAHWSTDPDNVVITLDGNGGSVEYGDKHAVARGSGIQEFSRAYRNEYVLDGWFTEPDGGRSVTVFTPVYSNVTWYAHWIKIMPSTSRQLVFRFQEEWGESVLVSDNRETFHSSETIRVHCAYNWHNPSYGGNPTGCVQTVLLRHRDGMSKQFDTGDYEIKNVKSSSVSADSYFYSDLTDFATYPANTLEPGEYAVYVVLNNDKGIDANGDFKTQLEQFGEGVYWKMKQFTVTAAPVTVTFDANGGTVSEETRTVSSGSAIGSFPTPTRSGYTFDGWYTAATGGTKITADTVVSGDVTYYAHWSVKTRATVTFDANGGFGDTCYTLGVGHCLSSLPSAWHTNLVFAGWYTHKEGGVQFTLSTVVHDDVKVYARWVEDDDHVVVTLDANGGWVYPGSLHAVARGSGIAEFSSASRFGYVLDGWFTESDGGTRVMVSTPVYSNVTWYAHWTKAVSSTNPCLEFYFEEEWGDSMMVSDDSPSYMAVGRSSFNTAEGIRIYHEYHWQNYNKGNNPTGLVQVVLLRNRQGASQRFDIGDYEIKNVRSRSVSSNSIYVDFASYSKNTLEPGEYAVYVILNHDKEIDAKIDFKTQMEQFGESVHWKMRQFTVEAAPVTVTFNAYYSDATVSPATRTLAAGSKVGELPIPVWKNHAFIRWRPSRSSYADVTSETVVWNNVTYYAQWTSVAKDSADSKDDVAKGAVNWTPNATPTKFERSLRSDDPEDNFKITGRDGALYDISLAFAEKQVGCDAVFSITNANGVTVCDVNGMPIDHVTSATQIVMPKTKTPYYLTVMHGTPEKRSGNYTITGHYADAGAIKFAKTAVSVKESAAYVDLTVNRTGKDGRVRVKYATADGTAKAGEDYVAQSGVLEWADGDRNAKKIRVTLIPDLVAVYDGVKSKTFSVTLTPFAAIERAADEVPAVIAGGDTCEVTIAETSKPGTTAETVYAKYAAKRATVKTEDVPLESGTFYGLLQTDYGDLTNGFPRLGSITFTASTAKTPALSAKVSIAGKTYAFSGKGWDENWRDGILDRTLLNVMKIGKSVYTNELYVAVPSGSTTSESAWLMDDTFVELTMNVPDANGKGVQENVNYWNYSIYRSNAKIQSYLDIAQKFAGYYTMGLMGCNGGNGYLTMTVDNKGNAKIAGMLPDGTTKPSLSVKACGIREDSESANGYAMYIPVFQAKSPYCFGGEIRLYALRDENAPDGSGMKIVVDENWSCMEWYNDKDAMGGEFSGGPGFEELLWTCGGWYDKAVNLQRYYLDYALSVGTAKIDEFPYEFLPGDNYSFVAAAQPDGFALAFENDKIVHDKKKIVKTNGRIDFAQSVNAGNVSVKFTRATGVFTGGCSLLFADEYGLKQKELTGFKAYGVFVLNRQPDDGASCLPDYILAPGCLTRREKWTLVDEDTNRRTSVNWSFSVPFNVLGD